MTLVEVVIALGVAALTIGGIVNGYIYCATSAIKAELAQSANEQALQRIEQVRSAQWDIAVYPAIDQLVATNFPDETNILDLPGTNTAAGTPVLIQTTITNLVPTPLAPPMRTVHVDCIWQFRGGDWITNSIETILSPNQ
jgi:type II secretory pathway pseudopilin PulG